MRIWARSSPMRSPLSFMARAMGMGRPKRMPGDRKSTRLNSSHLVISYAVFCLKKKNKPLLNIQHHHHHAHGTPLFLLCSHLTKTHLRAPLHPTSSLPPCYLSHLLPNNPSAVSLSSRARWDIAQTPPFSASGMR